MVRIAHLTQTGSGSLVYRLLKNEVASPCSRLAHREHLMRVVDPLSDFVDSEDNDSVGSNDDSDHIEMEALRR